MTRGTPCDWLPIRERERRRYRCGSCGADVSMAYLRPPDERIHNRPLCEPCGVPMAVVDGE